MPDAPKLSPRGRFYLLTLDRIEARRAAGRTTTEEEVRVMADLEHAWDRLSDPERETIETLRDAKRATEGA
jgi:hypothetical protein